MIFLFKWSLLYLWLSATYPLLAQGQLFIWLLIPTLSCAQWEQLFSSQGRLIFSSLARTSSCPLLSNKRKAQRSRTCDLSFYVLEPHSRATQEKLS